MTLFLKSKNAHWMRKGGKTDRFQSADKKDNLPPVTKSLFAVKLILLNLFPKNLYWKVGNHGRAISGRNE